MRALGIDFGTSTTLVALHDPTGGVKLLKNSEGDEVVPSVVAFTPQNRVLVGKAARNRRLMDPENALYSLKRILGRPWTSQDVRTFVERYPFKLEAGPDGYPRLVTRAGKLTVVQA